MTAPSQFSAEPGHASLPMYDWPEVASAWGGLWRLIRDSLISSGIPVEQDLRRPADMSAQWRDASMILSQTCGWPFVSALREVVIPFGRFDFALAGQPGDYHSVFITQEEESPARLLADQSGRIAVNSTDSQSGFRVLSEIASGPCILGPERVLLTGSHRASIQAVADGLADLAAIDAVSWRLAQLYEPAAQQVFVAGRSMPVPGLPLITSQSHERLCDLLFQTVSAAVDGLSAEEREVLGLAGFVSAADEDYRVLLELPFGQVSAA